jgi:GDP-mannose 6-dehydrogenase
MKISIFGLGYVGTVSLGCLAKLNHVLIGVDINKKKVDLINKGKSAILEPGLDELIEIGIKQKLISATQDYKYAVMNSEITFVCIGTPGKKDGKLDLRYLFNSLKQIAEGLKVKKSFHTVVIRSTVHPGTYNKIVSLLEKCSGKKSSKDFSIIINPEFLREGTAVYDFFNPPMNIIGSSNKTGVDLMKEFYKFNKATTYIVSTDISELIKLVSNTFHTIKISFANEIGNLCNKLDIDSNEIMNLLVRDSKLNISRAYLQPGFAFGGSCLPKDLKAINKIAKNKKLKMPLISSIITSNEQQKKNAFNLIKSLNEKNIGIWGLSFKPGTDDLRSSPVLDVINLLLKDGYKVKLFDQNVCLKNIIGANRKYIFSKLPGIERLMENDFEKFLNFSKVLIVNSYDNKLIIDLAKLYRYKIVDLININQLKSNPQYYGLCW